jgi:hypothetical protein
VEQRDLLGRAEWSRPGQGRGRQCTIQSLFLSIDLLLIAMSEFHLDVLQVTLQALGLSNRDLSSLDKDSVVQLKQDILTSIEALKANASTVQTAESESSKWVPFTEPVPVTSYAIDDPVLKTVFATWTDDNSKVSLWIFYDQDVLIYYVSLISIERLLHRLGKELRKSCWTWIS